MSDLELFARLVRRRSREHQLGMQVLACSHLPGLMVSVLRQELDSMVRVIYLRHQSPERQAQLLAATVHGERWTREGSGSRLTDAEMVQLADRLHDWTRSVYTFGCAFIHLSHLHDYTERDPLTLLDSQEREVILSHLRRYHGGPAEPNPTFADLHHYLPQVLQKIARNLEHELRALESGERPT